MIFTNQCFPFDWHNERFSLGCKLFLTTQIKDSASLNDNRSVGKVGTNGNLSDAVTGGNSPQQNYSKQSVGNPSSLQEADAKQNKGEHNTYPQHLAGGQTQQSNGSNDNGYKPNDSNNDNQ